MPIEEYSRGEKIKNHLISIIIRAHIKSSLNGHLTVKTVPIDNAVKSYSWKEVEVTEKITPVAATDTITDEYIATLKEFIQYVVAETDDSDWEDDNTHDDQFENSDSEEPIDLWRPELPNEIEIGQLYMTLCDKTTNAFHKFIPLTILHELIKSPDEGMEHVLCFVDYSGKKQTRLYDMLKKHSNNIRHMLASHPADSALVAKLSAEHNMSLIMEKKIREYFHKTMVHWKGLMYEKGIVHNDTHSANVIITTDDNAELIDFDRSRFLPDQPINDLIDKIITATLNYIGSDNDEVPFVNLLDLNKSDLSSMTEVDRTYFFDSFATAINDLAISTYVVFNENNNVEPFDLLSNFSTFSKFHLPYGTMSTSKLWTYADNTIVPVWVRTIRIVLSRLRYVMTL